MRLSKKFEACLFFLRKSLERKRSTKHKTNGFHPLRSFSTHEKLLFLLVSVCLNLFCRFIFACAVFFTREIFFVKKDKQA